MKPCYQMLREYREDRGITQAHISRKTGKKVQRISALETGAVRLTADDLIDICINGLGISPAEFFAAVLSKNENKE